MKTLTVLLSEPLGSLMWLSLGGALLYVGLHEVLGTAGLVLAAMSVVPFLAVPLGGAITRALLHRDRDGMPTSRVPPHPHPSASAED